MNAGIEIGKLLLITGLVVAAIGGLLIATRGTLPIGHLPGDIVVKRDGFYFFLPITTSILLSGILSLIFWLVSKHGK